MCVLKTQTRTVTAQCAKGGQGGVYNKQFLPRGLRALLLCSTQYIVISRLLQQQEADLEECSETGEHSNMAH